jgi:uncharacterized protein
MAGNARRPPGQRPRPAARLAAALAVAGVGLAAACSQGSGVGSSPPLASRAWVDQPVSFEAGGLTIYATYRHPVTPAAGATGASPVPAVLLIAGSGPTDRNGNSPLLPGLVNTLEVIAGWLSADGVASLRFDKLGSGRTGLGPYASRPGAIGIGPFEQEAAAGLRFLARQPGVDRGRLAVIGHSEGALFALLLATHADAAAGPIPPIRALGLLEPLGVRYLDAIAEQVDAQAAAAQRTGQITARQASMLTHALATATASLRATGTVPAALTPALSGILNPVTALFLYQADRYDPARLAARIRPRLPVLVTCSNADAQVTCGEVHHLLAGLARAPADTDFVPLTGVDHVLKQDPTGAAANYAKPLPFSVQLRQALRAFVDRNL